jgi:hypothetical protein
MMGVRSIAILLACAAAACGRVVGNDPSRPAAADTIVVPGVDTVWAVTDSAGAATDTITTATVVDTTYGLPDPEPEPRPGAIGCRRTDTPRPVPETAIVQDIRGGARFSCVLREGHPPVEARVDADDEWGFVEGARISAPAWERPWSQALAAEAIDRPYVGSPVLEAIDFDKDGWGDLRMREWSGATGNRKYHVFRFDPRRQRFARDSALSETVGLDTLPGPPCVRGYYHGGGRAYDLWTTCLERGRWVDVMSESQSDSPGKPFFVRQRKERRGGRMVVVRTDTLTGDQVWDQR